MSLSIMDIFLQHNNINFGLIVHALYLLVKMTTLFGTRVVCGVHPKC